MAKPTQDDLKNLARFAAVTSDERHAYLPTSMDEAGVFEPHAWVLDAMERAYRVGRVAAIIEKL